MSKMKFFIAVLAVVCGGVLTAQNPAEPSAGWITGKFGPRLVDVKKREVDAEQVLQGKMVVVYFSAAQPAQCKAFTPKLGKFYHQTAKKHNLELILVGKEKTADAMHAYMKSLPAQWRAIPWGEKAAVALEKELKIKALPVVAVFSPEGKLISANARWDVEVLGEKAVARWKSDNYRPLTVEDWRKKNGKTAKPNKKHKKSRKSKK